MAGKGIQYDHLVRNVWICSRLLQAFDEFDVATAAARKQQRGHSTESSGINISPTLGNIST